MKSVISAVRNATQKLSNRLSNKKQSSGAVTPGRKDNMAGMAIEAKKGGMMNKLKMVTKDGKKVPAFAADGVGKMKKGGMADKAGRAMKKTSADAKGRAMKKGK
jgi:hypothetical protein